MPLQISDCRFGCREEVKANLKSKICDLKFSTGVN